MGAIQRSTATPPALSAEPDPAILRLARALARQAAREDHAREIEKRDSRGYLVIGRKGSAL